MNWYNTNIISLQWKDVISNKMISSQFVSQLICKVPTRSYQADQCPVSVTQPHWTLTAAFHSSSSLLISPISLCCHLPNKSNWQINKLLAGESTSSPKLTNHSSCFTCVVVCLRRCTMTVGSLYNLLMHKFKFSSWAAAVFFQTLFIWPWQPLYWLFRH